MSNFYVGQKVVCVDDNYYVTYADDVDPKKGDIVTIRTIEFLENRVWLRFKEFVNPSNCDEGVECRYNSIRFAPLLTDSIEFAETLLNEITIEINEENLITK